MSDDPATQDAVPSSTAAAAPALNPAAAADMPATAEADAQPPLEAPAKVAVVSASNAPPPPPRQMSREEFLRQMGLAPDDVAEGPPSSTAAKTVALVPSMPEAPRLAGDAPEVMQDDQWVRSTVFADVTLVGPGAVDLISNDAKKSIMETFKASRSSGGGCAGTMTVDGDGGAVVMSSTSSVDERRATDLVSREDHEMASDYKASLLEEFRKRKKCGEAKVPPPASPQRRRPGVETAA